MRFALLFILAGVIFSSCAAERHRHKYTEGDTFTRPPVYHSPESMATELNMLHAAYPLITSTSTVGYSVSGRPIYAFIISGNPATSTINISGTDFYKPRIRLTGSIHGNEYISGEILISFIKYLLQNYDAAHPEYNVTRLVDTRYIAIIPMLNPDGVASSTRNNAHGVDLNRNFSYKWTSGGDHGTSSFSQPESAALRDYSLGNVFHLAATYHSGAVIVNMPFDYGCENRMSGDCAGHPDAPIENDFVKYISRVYTAAGTFLTNPGILNDPPYVVQGTINGGDWYVANGTLQDWSYMEAGCMEVTIEVANSSPLTAEGIDQVFMYNRDSIIAYMDAAGTGVYGRITPNGTTTPVAGAKVYIWATTTEGDLQVRSDSDGYYFKILKNGTYTVYASSTGYSLASTTVTIESSATSTRAVRRDFQLIP